MKNEPISVTIDESPELHGRPAVAVLATFYDDELPGRRTLMIDLQIELHKDLQLSNPEFKALHFRDPCHLLNNALEDGIRTSSFNVVHDFVVHFPAMLKSSRELRRTEASLAPSGLELLLAAVDCIDGEDLW
ncbi:hypothetical protein HPB49_023126 [Dermacentor silvarum]|uniref:Uncharacterized protein n=1 Tax=Dermacentor silvarum TaxID=543639 RepID=A0ACB8CBV0_DERSI|nr:hypothetical protein HPB49_023126 [Dermacentor silvarum]